MEELLRIPILGIEDAIVVLAILADQFELKPELLDFIRAAEAWLEKEPPCSIMTWDDLVSKFLNRFYPHSKTRELRKGITNFQQVFGETFTDAWERFKYLLRKSPHHGFSLLHQIDFFYNGLSQSDQDFLNTAASGNLMSKNTQEDLTIIENKAKVRTCRNKPQVSSSSGSSTQIDAITALTKQVEALEYHIASMRETYDQNQEASIQSMQNQMGQLEEDFQERPLGVLSSDTETYTREERKAVTTMSGLTLDGSFIPHSNFLVYQEKEQESGTITEVVEIANSQSTPLVPPPETPPLSAPKPKEDPKPNPHQPPIPSWLQEENFQALENPTGRADHFVYCIDIVDSLCDKFPIENNSLSGNPTPSSNSVVESLSPSLTPFGDIDLLLEETDAFLALNSIPPYLPPLELNNDPEGDILFLENLLKDEPLEVEESQIYPPKGESSNTFLIGDEEIKVDPFKEIDDTVLNPKVSKTPLDSLDSILDSYDISYTNPSELDSKYTLNYDNPIFNIQNGHCDEPETETIMDEVHSTIQIPPLFEELTSDKSMQDIILHQIRHGMVNSSRLSFYLDLFSPEDNFGSLSSDSFELGD
ncbi:reverse transcriptase domain-containing protein [Tanacetum coccineum]